jgi:hypothetical protein
MTTAEETGTPGEVRVRFERAQREQLLDELELYRDVSCEGLTMAKSVTRPNPDYARAKERDIEEVERLIRTITTTTEPGQDFEVVGPAYILGSCVRSAATLMCERLCTRVDELRPGLDSSNAVLDLLKAKSLAHAWLNSLIDINGFEPPLRQPPPPTLPQ